ncbi:glutamate-rich protein 1 isoform 2, partial [Daubentonia madagascariensis]
YVQRSGSSCVETTEELLHHLESRRPSPSDVFVLDHMKTLLLLQDIGRLKSVPRTLHDAS